MYLVISVEATDMPQPHLSVAHPRQPHLLSFAAIAVNETGNEVGQYSTLVKPRSGAALPLKAYQTHEISLELAANEGEDAINVFSWFNQNASNADCIVGHGLDFTLDVMRILSSRITGKVWTPPYSTFCTMQHSAPKVRKPGLRMQTIAGGYGHNGPSLSQCMDQFFDEPLSGFIDQLKTVRSCNRIFRYLTHKNVTD